jgi:hypothetical protein
VIKIDRSIFYTAKFMGFKMSPPAYLTLPNRIRVHQGFIGVNYACANAGLRDPEHDVSGHSIPFFSQYKDHGDKEQSTL